MERSVVAREDPAVAIRVGRLQVANLRRRRRVIQIDPPTSRTKGTAMFINHKLATAALGALGLTLLAFSGDAYVNEMGIISILIGL